MQNNIAATKIRNVFFNSAISFTLIFASFLVTVTNDGRAITINRAIHELSHKLNVPNRYKRVREQQVLVSQSWKGDKCIGSNKDSPIFWKSHLKLFCNLGEPILFSLNIACLIEYISLRSMLWHELTPNVWREERGK